MSDIDDAIETTKELKSNKRFNQVALTMHQQIKKRIYTEGKNARDQRIGNYAPSTLKTRRSAKNIGRVPQSLNIILQFTGQMQRDFSPIKKNGRIIGSGFKNKINSQKVRWIERQQRQKIFKMSPKEIRLFERLLQNQANRIA